MKKIEFRPSNKQSCSFSRMPFLLYRPDLGIRTHLQPRSLLIRMPVGRLFAFRRLGLLTMLSACMGLSLSPVFAANDVLPPVAASKQVAELLNSKKNPLLQTTDYARFSSELSSLYQNGHNGLLWLNPNRSSVSISAALDLLSHADQHGLDPSDYETEALTRLKQSTAEADHSATEVNNMAAYDIALSTALLHYIHDLHEGRVQPQNLSYPDNFGRKARNAVAAIKQALEQEQIAQLPQQFEPRNKQYQRLRQSLNELRAQSAEAPFPTLQLDKSLHPGESNPQVNTLKDRLSALSALTSDVMLSGEVYDGVLVEGVKSIQQQYGLQADGIIGRDTLALLNQTRADKIRQIELAMERLRWLPEDLNGPLIIVNIPAFQLWAFNSSDESPALNMKVIVGKAQENQTPMLYEDMQYLEFMPYWNIPKSIMDKEIVPKLQDDMAYLDDQNIELVQRFADEDGNEDIVTELRQGKLRARQRPGKKNPLGKVKFIFPNKEDVYLHDTPSHGLFARSRRDFSHGCVRVSEAEKLAEFVLSRQSGWDRETIQQAMNSEKTQRVKLKQSIPVLFFYSTSFVDQNNKLHFYRDIYGRDAELQKALSEKRTLPGKDSGSLVTGKNISAG